MSITDDDVLAAIEDATETGETLQNEGVLVEVVAERLPVTRSATRQRLNTLWLDGHVKKGWGVPPDGGPRRTYRLCQSED